MIWPDTNVTINYSSSGSGETDEEEGKKMGRMIADLVNNQIDERLRKQQKFGGIAHKGIR